MRFEDCGRLPSNGDNVAIAVRRLEAGTRIADGEREYVLSHTILEGHRFVCSAVVAGEPLLSWGLPFGDALRALAPGEYICNQSILQALGERDVGFALPDRANFVDRFEPYELDVDAVVAGQQVAPLPLPGTFEGFRRAGTRGVGTRNFLVVIALTSADAAIASAVAERMRELKGVDADCEVVAVTHTEGGGRSRPHNLAFVLRALAGFVVHANTGAALVVDQGAGSYGASDLREFLQSNDYEHGNVPHELLELGGSIGANMQLAMGAATRLYDLAAQSQRSEQPLSELRIALQCGGSDAFSGVSGNSLAGWVAKELIRHGGGANLAETDELIGAESYVLANVRSGDVAKRFLDKVAIFKQRVENHGASAEGNPSGGNNYRGLYNIALKSLGAARKKDPDVRLDDVLDYGERMLGGGYYFMDSPGNDLESIAGQVASGCNLILFITGNGSITNFPFVPTLKFVTTTGRFELMRNEMDVNAGRYNDGMSMEELGAETFELVRSVASGRRTKGEAAGHSQVSIWREWRQQDDAALQARTDGSLPPSGEPLPATGAQPLAIGYEAHVTARGLVSDRVGLIMPTSLCSGQVAEHIAAQLNKQQLDTQQSDTQQQSGDSLAAPARRYVALAHTEGCGAANAEELYLQTMLGHLRHPFVDRALLLEHGCEKTHNDAVRHWLTSRGEDPGRYGYASVQLDGGIERVQQRVVSWFADGESEEVAGAKVPATAESLHLAVFSSGELPSSCALVLARFCAGVVAAGGTVVLPSNDALLDTHALRQHLFAASAPKPTLAYGQFAEHAGLHVMHAPTEDVSETVTGLGGTGAELMLAHVGNRQVQCHPMIPVLQVSGVVHMCQQVRDELDLLLPDAADDDGSLSLQSLADLVAQVLSGHRQPNLVGKRHAHFQLTRGEFGVSL